MNRKGLNSEHTKIVNRLLVLQSLCLDGIISRTDLARNLGLAKMTISNIVTELLEQGLIEEVDMLEVATGAGRRQVGLQLSNKTPLVIGLWFSRDFCVGVLSTMDLEIQKQYRIDFTEGDTIDSILDKLQQVVDFLKRGVTREILAVGVSTVGPLDSKLGIILNPPNFFDISYYPLAEKLEELLELPVFLENDMNASALAEKLFGKGKPFRHFVYVGLTNGIGSGVMIDNQLYSGNKGFAGELGHVTVQMDGDVCVCGSHGCLEAYFNEKYLFEQVKKATGQSVQSFEQFCKMADENPQVETIMELALRRLGTALVTLCNLIDPEIILLGHDAVYLTEGQQNYLKQYINDNVLAKGILKIQLAPAHFGAYAPTQGAITVVLDKIFHDDIFFERFFPNA